MLKHTLHISNPSYLSLRNHQLVIHQRETDTKHSIPIEDIATIIIADQRSTLSTAIMSRCISEGIALISCDEKYMPIGMFQRLDGHSEQQSITAAQVESSLPLRKQLWQSTIRSKIKNQALLLDQLSLHAQRLHHLSAQVKSGDSTGIESQAARYYWTQYFGDINSHHGIPDPTYRKRDGYPPNNWLNYGYTILRSMVTRALTASGLLPVLGIHHHNKYNAFCLSDDIMEPFRPIVDQLVHQLCMLYDLSTDIPMRIKSELLQIPTLDCVLDDKTYTLQSALERTTASLAQSFVLGKNQLLYPKLYAK